MIIIALMIMMITTTIMIIMITTFSALNVCRAVAMVTLCSVRG